MATHDKSSDRQALSKTREHGQPNSPKRRAFMVFAGSAAGATVLGTLPGCGGSSDSLNSPPTPVTPPVNPDPIWGTTGQATAIINKLANITTAMFPQVDFQVTSYGARTLLPSAMIQASAWPGGIPWVTGSQAAGSPQSPGSTVMVPYDMTDTMYDSYTAFNAAIQAAHAAGGGRVVVPAGNWYCGGPIVLLSNVNFHLSSGCTIYFSPNPADYAKNGPYPTANGNLYWSRWQANDCLNFAAPIYAYQQTNIGLTADDNTCVLNGQAMTPMQLTTKPATSCWWTFKGTTGAYGYVAPASKGVPVSQADANTGGTPYVPSSTGNAALTGLPAAQITNPQANVSFTNQDGATTTLMTLLTTQPTTTSWQQDQNYLPALSELGVPVLNRVFGLGHFLRPCMVEFIGCTNVLLQNYHTQNTPFWQHHPTDCTNVVIDGVFADSIGPNNDGFDPDACNYVLVQNVQFNTGDDCIAIKSGKCLDTQYGPMQNIVVQNCTMQSGHGGLTIGSEMSAGVENVYARNLTMQNANWATNPLNIALRFKTNMNRGGFINNVWINGVTLPNGVNLTGKYGGGALGSAYPGSVAGKGTVGLAANPSTGQGGLITFDCDYSPSGDAVRWNPATINNVNISNVNATNTSGAVSYALTTGFSATTGSCFQALVAQGSVAADYNGPPPVPAVPPITGVTISNCNLGTPICTGPASSTTPGPVFVNNVKSITLSNVVIGGVTYNSALTG